ncbi:hypothetical protein AVEN_149937-1 [Araneus ventricosus]|uniref:Uncharacterized protein n=1 Tax=Araneus ventricosus TaxID=182803 RepID=A0A4Y2M3A6_ARAVE|nr:hypothetical protein AVEN_149937-1 [Araneus ventricosus]
MIPWAIHIPKNQVCNVNSFRDIMKNVLRMRHAKYEMTDKHTRKRINIALSSSSELCFKSPAHREGAPHGNEDALDRRPCIESYECDLNAGRKFVVKADISARVLTMTTEDTYSLSEIQKAQLEDPDIRPVLEKKLTSRQEIARESSNQTILGS